MRIKKPKFWDYKKPNFFSYFLLPLTLPLFLKNIFSKKKIVEINKLKKICVGNIYIGGTGKTPLAIMISNILSVNQKKTAVIKKFYKDQIDEQVLIKQYTNLICKKSRTDALDEAKIQNLDYTIFDDGLQDNSINYNLKIVCFNNIQWIGNGFLIPAGPLRESLNSLKKYDAVVLNGDNSKNTEIKEKLKKINNKIHIFESYYEPTNLKDFDKKKNYVVFSGIGNNENFFNLLNDIKIKIIKKFSFPDHYNFKDEEINNITNFAKENNSEIITTEKDFLRINKEFKKKIKFLKVETKMYNPDNFYKFLKNYI